MTRPLALVLVLMVGFACGLIWLFGLQFASGEAYPDYSTMRTDPAGAKAIYDSLSSSGGFDVSRNYQALDQASFTGTTIVLLGVSPRLSDKDADLYERLASRGNRVVVALEIDEDWKPASDSVLTKRWKMKGVPKETALLPRGKGAVVVLSAGYVFQNGALAELGDTPLILWALGPGRTVVFDETHLGIVESGSVVGLARRYRLQGFAWGSLVLVALFLWRAMSPFPPAAATERQDSIAGRTSASGLAGLLRQNVRPESLVRTGWELWTKGHPRNVAPSRRARAEALVGQPADPLTALAEIHKALESKGANDTRATQERA
jgi:hypothetical protein